MPPILHGDTALRDLWRGGGVNKGAEITPDARTRPISVKAGARTLYVIQDFMIIIAVQLVFIAALF
ncbi:hypothetical protein M2322_004335 [Rhodoblastus acidophilus]|uniref:hypothetical protein n=1 Tax=Rhodoblastus acidophilus TaxID=1074 RepID=UPI00222417B7|nr:hypothetical protein [Rhodoblastus acidophilus]MCW2318766.1 hypothetical protein [Rhodoblastus acidophilus]